MRLWKVSTLHTLVIKNNYLIVEKRYTCAFVTDIKYIYANTETEAKTKYKELFFKSLEDGITKNELSMYRWVYDGCTPNMSFNLNIYQSIIKVNSTIDVDIKPVNASIDTIKHKITADDFRDWFMNGTTK